MILSSTLTVGWKNEKQPSGPIELDLEAGNLVTHLKVITASQHQEIPTVSGDIDENDQISKERLQSPRLARINPSFPTISAYVQRQ